MIAIWIMQMDSGHGDTEINKYCPPLGIIDLKIMTHYELFRHIA